MTDRTVQVVMTENAWDGPTLLADGTTQTLTASLAGSLVQDGKARYVDPSDQTSNPGAEGEMERHAAEHAAMGSISAILDASATASVVTLIPGEHQSVALAAGNYWVDAEFDVLVKSSSASACYGAELTDDTDAYSTTSGSLASQTGLNFGTADFSFEAWVQLNGPTPNQGRLIGFGSNGTTQMDVYFSNASSTTVRCAAALKNAAGGTIVDDASASALSAAYPLGNYLYHLVVTVDRAAGGGTGTLRYYLNGVQVQTKTWTEAAGPDSFNLNDNVAGAATLCIGGTVGKNAEWDGRIEDIKFYKTLLTISQIEARAAAGPVRSPVANPIDTADLTLSWWLSFQNSGDWGNALYPECVSGYGNAVFNSLVGSPAITERSGGAAASSLNSTRVRASVPQAIQHTGTYLNLYGDSASGGTVRITPLG